MELILLKRTGNEKNHVNCLKYFSITTTFINIYTPEKDFISYKIKLFSWVSKEKSFSFVWWNITGEGY